MDIRKKVIDDVIEEIDAKSTRANEEYDSTENVSEGLSKINNVFPNEVVESFSLLKDVSEEDFNVLLERIYGQDEGLIKILKGAYYVIKHDLGLFDSQVEYLNNFLARVNVARKELDETSKRLVVLSESIRLYSALKSSLGKVQTNGVLDVPLIESVVNALGYSDEEQSDYLDSVLAFNYERFKDLGLSRTNDLGNIAVFNEEEKNVQEEVGEEVKGAFTEEDLRNVFNVFEYDLSKMNPLYVKALIQRGNLENIVDVLDAIASNKISGLFTGSKKDELLTKFLLNSNKDIINHVCGLFSTHGIDKKYLKSYIPAFFSNEERRKNSGEEKSDIADELNLSVKGAYQDFVENVKYLVNNFNYDKKNMFERCATVLTMSHERLLRNVEELELYGYPIHGNKFPLSAFVGSRIMDSTDSFIELGEGDYLRKIAPSKLVFECGSIAKTIYAYQKRNLPYKSDSVFGAIKLSVTTFRDDSLLLPSTVDSIVPKDVSNLLNNNFYSKILIDGSPKTISEETMKNPVVIELEEKYKVDDDLYRFDDVLISRRKLLRNYECLMNSDLIDANRKKEDNKTILLVSAISNSMLTISDVEKIDRSISGVLSSKGGHYEVPKK